MILPKSIPHSLRCPSCQPFDGWKEQLANLKWDLHILIGSEHLSYYCDNCKNGFTTTESDTISLKRYHSKKRSVYRKNKINKLGI
jgi:hypothetical protein